MNHLASSISDATTGGRSEALVYKIIRRAHGGRPAYSDDAVDRAIAEAALEDGD